jgi:ribonuclease P protein component
MYQRGKREGLRSEERLRRKRDFEIVAKEGIRRFSRHFIIIMRRNELAFSRVGAVAGKKTGKAVDRNRVKRLIREFFRKNKGELPLSTDYIIVGKKGAQELKYTQVVEEIRHLLEFRSEDRRKSGEVSP